MRRLVFTATLLTAGLAMGQEAPTEATTSWHEVDARLVAELDGSALGAVCRAALESEPRDLPGALRLLSALSRAGWEDELPGALERVQAVSGEQQLASQGYPFLDALAQREQWEAAARGYELFPRAGAPSHADRFVDALARTRTPAALDVWLQARIEASEAAWADDPIANVAHGWRSARFHWHARAGTLQALIDEAAAAVRAEPEDPAHVRLLLAATAQIARGDSLDWIGEVCIPPTAFASYDLGHELARSVPAAAAPLLERSLKQAFTRADHEAIEAHVRRTSAAALEWARREDWEPVLRQWTHDALARVYLELERPQQAQRHMLAGKKLAEETGGAPDFGLAGMTQGASGQRVVQGELLREEAASADSPEYWLKRADYFRGRQEWGEAEQAYLRALALLPRGGQGSDGNSTWWPRWRALNGYAVLLKDKLARASEGLNLLREELAALDAASGEARQVVSGLTSYQFRDLLDPRDEVLWGYLEQRDDWDYAEANLLQTVAGTDLAKATRLGDRSPTRMFEVGLLLVNRGHHAKGEALLRQARAQLGEDPQRLERLDFALFESARAQRDWPTCLERWPMARARLTESEQTSWLGRMAHTAATHGDPGHALAIWRVRLNADHTALEGLERLAQAGLRAQLRELYAEQAEAQPESRPLAAALAALE